MASVYELANLSAMAYDPLENRFQGWHRTNIHGRRNGASFYAETYRNTSKREVALAIRGTDFRAKDIGDLYADLQIALGRVPYQFKAAKRAFLTEETYAKKDNYDIFLTGHSLGGGIAALVAAKQPIKPPVVTFNSPGMKTSFVKSHIIDAIGRYTYHNSCDISKFLHIRAHGDLISRGTGSHMGKVEFVYVDECGDEKVLGASRHLAQHSIDNMVKSLKLRKQYHKDLLFSPTSIIPKMMTG